MDEPDLSIDLSTGLSRITKTSVNFKQIYSSMVFWLQSYREMRLYAVFWGNWVFEMVIKPCCNFRSCILVILPNNLRIRVWRSLSNSFRFLPEFYFSEEVFPSFPNALITFNTVLLSTPNNSVVFLTQAPAITCNKNFTYFKVWLTCHSNEFWLIFSDDIRKNNNNFSKIRREKLMINK